MVKIHGVDPIVMDRIKERTQKEIVFQPEKTKVTADKNNEEKGRKKQKHNKKSLEEVVSRLNKLLEEEKAPLRFQIIVRDEKLKVQLLNIEENKVVSEVFPEKIYKLVRNPKEFSGFVVDEFV